MPATGSLIEEPFFLRKNDVQILTVVYAHSKTVPGLSSNGKRPREGTSLLQNLELNLRTATVHICHRAYSPPVMVCFIAASYPATKLVRYASFAAPFIGG